MAKEMLYSIQKFLSRNLYPVLLVFVALLLVVVAETRTHFFPNKLFCDVT